MKRILFIFPVIVSQMLVSCYGPVGPQGYSGYRDQRYYNLGSGYSNSSSYAARPTSSDSSSSVAPLMVLGGLALAAWMLSDGGSSSSSTTDNSTSDWSDAREAAVRREENRNAHRLNPEAPLPYPAEGL